MFFKFIINFDILIMFHTVFRMAPIAMASRMKIEEGNVLVAEDIEDEDIGLLELDFQLATVKKIKPKTDLGSGL